MRNRKKVSIAIILLIVFNTFIGVTLISEIDEGVNEKKSAKLKIANGIPLPYYAIIRSDEVIYRLFEHVNFTVNTYDFSDADHVIMQIDFSNGITVNYSMQFVLINTYSYEFTPGYDAPLGFQNVSFLIYDANNTMLNTHTTYTNFTITTNFMASNIRSEYYIGEDLNPNFLITKCSGWNLTIVNSTIESKQHNITNFEYNSIQFIYPITNDTFYEYLGKTFYIKLNMTDTDFGIKRAAYFPFTVSNTNPVIDEISIEFSPEELYRTEECDITLNATDTEDLPENLVVTMSIEDPQGNILPTITIDHDTNITFSSSFSIPAGSPVGKYKLEFNVADPSGGIDSYSEFLTVKNNLPEIQSYKINGRSGEEGIRISYGKDLVFTFNVSDVEEVAYIKVALIDKNYEWYNITREYIGTDTEITIRTVDLVTGVWYVQIYVIDSDGAITGLTDDYDKGIQSITIVPDALSEYLPWIIFFVGLILGMLISIGLAYRHFKSKAIDLKSVTPKKKDVSSRKLSIKKKEKEKLPEEILEKEDEEEVTSEIEEGSVPQRKIKRKL
ncbi:MAG: hypothetical protein ACFFAI_07285 [Promethearchaeota archaeon]